jgi:uroporphyrinogen III methyltransferase / synthase
MICLPDPQPDGTAARLPLAGKRILVTRPEDQGAELCAALRKAGAEPVHVPLIAILPLQQFSLLDEAVAKLQPGDWIFLTSQNAAATVSLRVSMRRSDLLQPGGAFIAAVGPATAEKARNVGLRVDFVPRAHSGVSIAEELGERLHGRRVLLPRSDKASPDLPAVVRRHGGEPLEVIAYRTELSEKEDILRRIGDSAIDAITLYSPTEAQVLHLMATREGIAGLQGRVPILAIGEVTASACNNFGVQAPLVAADATVGAVIEALSKHFAGAQNGNPAGANEP